MTKLKVSVGARAALKPSQSTSSAKKAIPANSAKAAVTNRKALPAAPVADLKKSVEASKSAKAVKPPKLHQKPVRDSFTMPAADFAVIATLKARVLAARRETKKSELLRAGLHALAALDTKELLAALGKLDPIKVGRPKKNH